MGVLFDDLNRLFLGDVEAGPGGFPLGSWQELRLDNADFVNDPNTLLVSGPTLAADGFYDVITDPAVNHLSLNQVNWKFRLPYQPSVPVDVETLLVPFDSDALIAEGIAQGVGIALGTAPLTNSNTEHYHSGVQTVNGTPNELLTTLFRGSNTSTQAITSPSSGLVFYGRAHGGVLDSGTPRSTQVCTSAAVRTTELDEGTPRNFAVNIVWGDGSSDATSVFASVILGGDTKQHAHRVRCFWRYVRHDFGGAQ